MMPPLVGAFVGIIAYLIGGFDTLLITCVQCTIFDFATGMINAAFKGHLSARECGKGILRKIMMYLVIALSNSIQNGMGLNVPLREITISFYVVQEALSILENVGGFVRYPDKLRDILSKLSDKGEGNE